MAAENKYSGLSNNRAGCNKRAGCKNSSIFENFDNFFLCVYDEVKVFLMIN